jgi:hypothetical protein
MNRQREGQIIRIGNRWYVRYWERRNRGGTVERKRVAHPIGFVTTRGKHPPADVKAEAERYMTTVNHSSIPPNQIITFNDFVETYYLPWVRENKRHSTVHGYEDVWRLHLKPLAVTKGTSKTSEQSQFSDG